MNEDGKWRFTSPTHVVLAFAQALEELKAEGGVPARHARYDQNQRLLAENFRALGFVPYLDPAVQDLPHTSTGADRAPSSPPSGIRRAPVSPSSRCMNTSRPGAMFSIPAR